MVLDPTLHGSVQEATGQKLTGESLKDVGRLEPSQRLPLENGIGGEDRVERHTLHFSLCTRVFFKMRRCSCYNLKTTKYFYGFYPIYWCSLPNWKHGVCGRRMSKLRLDWSGWAVGLEVCVSDHGKCRPLSREATGESSVFKRYCWVCKDD